MPWIGPGPNDRHLDHQVVKRSRLEPGQHAHLRPALDLEHAHRVGAADHRINVFVAFGHVGQRQRRPLVLPHELKTFADGREHAQRQAIHLEDSQLVQIVLVPLDDGSLGHGRVLDGHQFAQWPLRHDHAAGVLRQVPRKADQLPHQIDKLHAPPTRN